MSITIQTKHNVGDTVYHVEAIPPCREEWSNNKFSVSGPFVIDNIHVAITRTDGNDNVQIQYRLRVGGKDSMKRVNDSDCFISYHTAARYAGWGDASDA